MTSPLLESATLVPNQGLGAWIAVYEFYYAGMSWECPCNVGSLHELTALEATGIMNGMEYRRTAREQFLSAVPLRTKQ